MDGRLYETDADGNPNVFNVERNSDGSWLNNDWTNSDNHWNADNEIVFRLRKRLFPRLDGVVFSVRVIQASFPSTKHFAYFV